MVRDFEHWRCSLCGALVNGVPADARPTSEIRGAGGKPTVRVILVARREVHRCCMASPAA